MAVEQGRCVEDDGLALSAAVVVDPRLAEVWQLVWATASQGGDPDEEAWSLETLAALLRLAYVQGYADAAGEAVPGSLFCELGCAGPRGSARRRQRTVGRAVDRSPAARAREPLDLADGESKGARRTHRPVRFRSGHGGRSRSRCPAGNAQLGPGSRAADGVRVRGGGASSRDVSCSARRANELARARDLELGAAPSASNDHGSMVPKP